MKIEDVLRIDCRDADNRKFLIKKFKSIPFVKENLENPKDIKELKEITRELTENLKFHYNTLTKHERRYFTMALYDDNYSAKKTGSYKIYTLYALDRREAYLKLCVFTYYSRLLEKKTKVEGGA